MNEVANQQSIEPNHGGQATEGALALKQFAAERLAQHRSRRAGQQARLFENEAPVAERRESSRRVRDAVVARYEQSLSYREFLAHESEKALERAQAEAEIATRNARAIADAQRQLLSELDLYPDVSPGPQAVPLPARTPAQPPVPASVPAASIAQPAAAPSPFDQDDFFAPRLPDPVERTSAPSAAFDPEPQAYTPTQALWEQPLAPEPAAWEAPASFEPPTLRVQLVDDLSASASSAGQRVRSGVDAAELAPEERALELDALDLELAFRHSEAFDGQSLALTPIPGNLIEFPRQLIAARKVRPRLAEGPLRDEPESEAPQLRIFEVEPDLVSSAPEIEEPATAAEWHGMVLDAPVRRIEDPLADLPMLPADVIIPVPVEPASVERRLMSMLVDGVLVLLGAMGAVDVFARFAPRAVSAMSLPHLGEAAAAALAASFLVYELLFFTFSEATPGMRLARLSFCTFTDDVPTRKAMRRRLGASLLAAAPLGLGILWLAVDGEHLGWHDRISRMYPREY